MLKVAAVLPFTRPKQVAPRPSRDWTQQEIAEFYRVQAALGRAGMLISVERGLSDEGDPWFVFCREPEGEPLVHFARIDSYYVVASAVLGGVVRGLDIRKLIADILDREELRRSTLPERSAGLTLWHPSALLGVIVGLAYFFSTPPAEAAEQSRMSSRESARADNAAHAHSGTGTAASNLHNDLAVQASALSVQASKVAAAVLSAISVEFAATPIAHDSGDAPLRWIANPLAAEDGAHVAIAHDDVAAFIIRNADKTDMVSPRASSPHAETHSEIVPQLDTPNAEPEPAIEPRPAVRSGADTLPRDAPTFHYVPVKATVETYGKIAASSAASEEAEVKAKGIAIDYASLAGADIAKASAPHTEASAVAANETPSEQKPSKHELAKQDVKPVYFTEITESDGKIIKASEGIHLVDVVNYVEFNGVIGKIYAEKLLTNASYHNKTFEIDTSYKDHSVLENISLTYVDGSKIQIFGSSEFLHDLFES